MEIKDSQVIELPYGARILCVQEQNNEPFIWCVINISAYTTQERVFELYGTGHLMKPETFSKRYYIGTFQLYKEQLVYHLFEILK